MEEKKLPWWRRALNVALDGLKSGFGLFSRSQKEDVADEPEIAAGQQEVAEEKIATIEYSPEVNPVSEVVKVEETAAAAVLETVVTEAAASVEPAVKVEQPEVVVQPVEKFPETEPVVPVEAALMPEIQEPLQTVAAVEEPVVEEHGEPEPDEQVEAVAEEEPTVLEEAPAEVEPVLVEEPPAVADRAPLVPEEAKAEVVAEDELTPVVAVEKPAAEIQVSDVREVEDEGLIAESVAETAVPDLVATEVEIAEETLPEVEIVEEPVVEAAVEQEPPAQENAVEEPVAEIVEAAELSAPIVEPETESQIVPEIEPVLEIEAEPEIVASAEPESEMVALAEGDEAEAIAEQGAPVELDTPMVELPIAEPVDEQAEDTGAAMTPEKLEAEAEAEIVAEPEAETTLEVAAEPASDEVEQEVADDPVPELSASPVELNEPVADEAPDLSGGDEAAGEVEELQEATAQPEIVEETEPEPETAKEAEPAPEDASEPASTIEDLSEPMELNEPISETTTEPTVANEAAPAVEEIAVEETPVAEAANDEAAVEPEVAVEAAIAQETADAAVAAPAADDAPDAEVDPEPTLAPQPAAQEPHKPFIKLESRDNEADLSPFSVIVSEVYDGPLDLLLDLIRKQDIDIYDIPIARITAQFLAYVNQLKSGDVDVAGEFIYMASLLIHIKSKMLLPRAPTGPEDAAEDPRRELVERLLEHERFKNAAQMLQQKQMLEAATWTNPGLREFKDDESAEPEIAADTVDLVRVFRDILERARNRPVINLQEDSVTVGQMIQFLSRRLTMEDKPIALHKLLSHTQSERALIAMFLALLELVRLQAILLRQDRAFSEIFIKKNSAFESVMNEGLSNARDDWQ